MFTNIISNLIMLLCHIQFKKHKKPILYIKGTGKMSSGYMIYTKDKHIYERMEEVNA